MTAALPLVVAVIALLTLVNFGLILLVIRRMLQIDPMITRATPSMPKVGDRVREFTATTIEGERVNLEPFLHGATCVAFLSSGCGACGTAVAGMAASPGTNRWLIFFLDDAVDGERSNEPALRVQDLMPIGDVVRVETLNGPMDAFGEIRFFPTFLRIEAGTITASSSRFQDVLFSESA